jgi:GxxExxY protein
MELNLIAGLILGESIKIHNDLGPGLLEFVYEEILYYRLNKRKFFLCKQLKALQFF